MSRLSQSLALLAIGLSMPFAAWSLGADANLEPDSMEWLSGAQAEAELPAEAKPPECQLKSIDEAGESVDAHPTACCWFLYQGRWWCVPC